MSIPHEDKQRKLWIVGEEPATYDAGDPAPASTYRHLVMTYADVGEEIGRTLGVYCFGVYWVLDRHANARGTCQVSIHAIAQSMSLGRMTVVRALAKLEAEKYIVRKQGKNRRGQQETNTYKLPHHCEKPGTSPGTSPSLTQVPGGANPSPPQGQKVNIPIPKSTSVKVSSQKTRMTEDYELTDEQIEQAVQRYGLTVEQVEREVEKFRDYYIAKGELRASWPASWRNWLRNREQYQRPTNGYQTKEDKRQKTLDYFMKRAQEAP